MRKGLLTLAITGLLFTGCSHQNKEVDLFQKIDKERYFKLEKYKGYFLKEKEDPFHDVLYSYYDLNKDGKSDLIALTWISERKGSKYVPEPFAFALRVDKNEDDQWDKYYFDRDGDYIFDDITSNPETKKTLKI